METTAQVLSNDKGSDPDFPGLYGARFYSDTDPCDSGNKVIKIYTQNTTHLVSSTTNIEGNAICSSPTSFVFEMNYFFEPIWNYSSKYLKMEFCNNANARLFALDFNIAPGEDNLQAKRLSVSLSGDSDAEGIIINSHIWYYFRLEFYNSTEDASSRLKIFLGERGNTPELLRDVAIKAKTDTPSRALLIHSATKIKGTQYIDDISFTLTDIPYSASCAPCEIDEDVKRVYDFEDGIPSERSFFVDMRLKRGNDFLSVDPAIWNSSQKNSKYRALSNGYTVLLVQTGEAVFVTGDDERAIFEGAIVVIPPKTTYSLSSEQEYNVISVSGDFEQLSRFESATILHDNIYGEGKKLAELVLYNRFGNEEYFTALCNAYIRFILLSLEYPKSDMNAIVYKMTDHIKKNYDNSELSITKLLRESGYAKDYVRTKFFEVVKMTPKKYLTTVRMKKAKELINLYGDDVSIARIAEQCGIVDPAVFSKNFKQFYGISPKQYMTKRKKG